MEKLNQSEDSFLARNLRKKMKSRKQKYLHKDNNILKLRLFS